MPTVTSPHHAQSFGYDELDRLTEFSDSNKQTIYRYDANGNRSQQIDARATKDFNLDLASNCQDTAMRIAPDRFIYTHLDC